MRSEEYIRFKADAMITSKNLYAVYQMWCEDNALKPLASKTFSAYLIGHAHEYNLEYTNNATNARGRRVRGFWGIELLVEPENKK